MQYYFLFVSTFLLPFIINHITTQKELVAAARMLSGDIHFNGYKQLSRKERRNYVGSCICRLLYIAIILWATILFMGDIAGVMVIPLDSFSVYSWYSVFYFRLE